MMARPWWMVVGVPGHTPNVLILVEEESNLRKEPAQIQSKCTEEMSRLLSIALIFHGISPVALCVRDPFGHKSDVRFFIERKEYQQQTILKSNLSFC